MTSSMSGSAAAPVRPGPGAAFRGDELVVALPYAPLVLSPLQAWAAAPVLEDQDRDPRLGLARIRLDAAAAASYLRARPSSREVPPLDEDTGAGPEPTDLDVVLRALRRLFAGEYAGWVPTMGKNRVMSRVAGSYVIDGGGGGGRPLPITGPQAPYEQEGTRQPGEPDLSIPLRGLSPGRGARVGVVDTRLSAHPWLAGGYVASARDLQPPQPTAPLTWLADHATFVVGLVLRQAPGAVVELRGGLDDHASQDSWTLARTIADLADASTDVVNLSLGCTTDDGRPPLVLSAALAALGPRTVVVAAAGNHGGADGAPPSPSWPAALDNVIAVGALDGDHPATFTPDAPWVDAMAPGVGLVSTYRTGTDGGGGLARWSGTSFAAAAVTGAIAAAAGPAGAGPAGSAQAAWDRMRETGPRDDRGRPLVALPQLPGWPADTPTPGR
jgi:hypothetical protein